MNPEKFSNINKLTFYGLQKLSEVERQVREEARREQERLANLPLGERVTESLAGESELSVLSAITHETFQDHGKTFNPMTFTVSAINSADIDQVAHGLLIGVPGIIRIPSEGTGMAELRSWRKVGPNTFDTVSIRVVNSTQKV